MATDWQKMKRDVPALRELEARARAAHDEGLGWWSTWRSIYEDLSKLIGPGSGSRWPTSKAFETAHRGLLWAWGSFDRPQGPPPWEIPEGETEPLGPALLPVDDTSSQGVGGVQ
jgi:hypothetical protein